MLKAKSRILFATKRGDKQYDNATFPDITDISDTFIMTFMSTMFVESVLHFNFCLDFQTDKSQARMCNTFHMYEVCFGQKV